MNWFGRKGRNAPNDMLSDSESGLGEHLGEFVEMDSEPKNEITLVTSLIIESSLGGIHAPVLDLDLDHVYYESTTPGHAALLLNVNLEWERYKRLLAILHECDIIQTGFYEASLLRGYSACRTPWTKKPAKVEDK